jgi:hypothetical protein
MLGILEASIARPLIKSNWSRTSIVVSRPEPQISPSP